MLEHLDVIPAQLQGGDLLARTIDEPTDLTPAMRGTARSPVARPER
jgi:hypothetical protein